jgi:FkbM family methyltransferase
MLNNIYNQPNQFANQLSDLRGSGRPIALYGAGEVARKVAGIFRDHNLTVNAVWTDTITVPPQIFQGITVQTIACVDHINDYSIVVCVGNYKSSLEKLRGLYHAEHIFIFDNIYSLPPIDHGYVSDNAAAFSTFSDSLSDVRSKDTMSAFLNARISGNSEYLFDLFDPNQYFPLDIPGYPNLSEHELFVDCGAFVGDTVIDFINRSNRKYKQIFAIEPDVANYQLLLTTIQRENIQNIFPICKGLSSSKNKLRFLSDSISSRVSASGMNTIELDTIDSILANSAVSFIKMDIEGFEFEAVKGARTTIQRQHPKLAISLYHKPEDMITIPRYISTLVPAYRWYLRAHKCMSIDVVLYGLVS